jgi:pteridine reductase
MTQAALVTGGAKRIGFAIANALAEQGYDIALHYHTSRSEAEQSAERIREKGRRCILFSCDLNRAGEVASLIPAVFKELPECTVLVNSASIFERAHLLETDAEMFERHFNVNFKAPFFLSKDFASRCGSGNIINICDTKIAQELTPFFVYSLTKKALYAFTRMASKELGPTVRVNAVAPGMILPSKGFGEEDLIRMSKKLPLQKKGEAEDVASAVLFLLRNEYITGQCIFVDGGEHLH